MITNLRLLHHLSEDTYKNVCRRLGIYEEGRMKNKFVMYPDKPIYRIEPFNLAYKEFGHIWFLYLFIDFPKFQCKYADFKDKLFAEYEKLFGKEVMGDFPSFEAINCAYVEYSNIFKVNDADEIIKNMTALKCPPEQLDKNLWNQFKKPHGTIEFCVAKKDKTHIETLARCRGSALKKRIDASLHVGTGINPAAIVSEQTENDIVGWLLSRYKINI